MRKWVWSRAAAMVLAGGVVLLGGQALGALDQPESVAEELRYARSLSNAFQHAAERVEPSVVHITSQARVQSVRRDVFGRQLIGPEQLRPTGLGSGVIADADGLIITNNHVVQEADRLVVRLTDGREFEASVVGTDPQRDIAVLKIDARDLPAAEFGESESLQVGEWVLAIGSPFGFENSVTAGIISATGRRGIGLVSERFKDYEDFIQTDAAINPGNSGGPLINLDGKVVGINTAIASRSGGSVGIGFAIPAHLVKSVMRNLVEAGRVGRGWLGVMMQELTPELAESFQLVAGQKGVVIASVLKDSPAAAAGLADGDVIVKIGDRAIDSASALITAIEIIPPKTKVKVQFFRGGRAREAEVVVGDRNERNTRMFGGKAIESLKATVATLDARAARELGYQGEEVSGALITDLQAGSPLARAGLEPEDIIYGVEGYRVSSVDELVELMSRADLRRGVRLQVIRGARRGFVIVRE
ncbi:MAG: Do family serine endopeptidase [Phycisphaerales bacterium]|nr:Do family serine endopeptidase [Phycisphaerales bacterium]